MAQKTHSVTRRSQRRNVSCPRFAQTLRSADVLVKYAERLGEARLAHASSNTASMTGSPFFRAQRTQFWRDLLRVCSMWWLGGSVLGMARGMTSAAYLSSMLERNCMGEQMSV